MTRSKAFDIIIWHGKCECAGIGRQARLRGVCQWRTSSSLVTRTKQGLEPNALRVLFVFWRQPPAIKAASFLVPFYWLSLDAIRVRTLFILNQSRCSRLWCASFSVHLYSRELDTQTRSRAFSLVPLGVKINPRFCWFGSQKYKEAFEKKDNNEIKKFSTHQVQMSVSYSLCTKIQKERSIRKTEERH